MPLPRRLIGLVALLAIALGSSSCTLVKPIVGAVTGPVYIIGHTGEIWSGGCHDGRAVVGVLAVSAAIGATAGLVTGIISDVQVLCGNADDPARNWWNPFEVNTAPSAW